MGIKRTAIWLFAWSALLVWMADRAVAQPAHSNLHYQVPHPTYENGPAPFANDTPGPEKWFNPFHPVGFEPEFDWFAPTETSGYGRGPRPNIGYFFSYERLYWSMSSPESWPVGSQTPPVSLLPPFSSADGPTVDNRWIEAIGGWGNRWEVGYVDTDDYGWLVSVLDHVDQGQYRIDNNPIIQFADPGLVLDGFVTIGGIPFELGTVPFHFDQIRMKNILQLNGVEVSRFYRARQLHSGAFFEFLYGARWFQINDAVEYQADGNGGEVNSYGIGNQSFTLSGNILDASIWSNRAMNNLVGPQIGMRLFRQRGRWVTSLETRFLAAANFQNIHLKTNLGTLDANLGNSILTAFRGLGSDAHLYRTTFAPMGELRVNVAWQATRSVGLKVGYTGMVVGNIVRASNTIDYESINLIGVLNGNFNQIFFVNGLNFGVEINR